MKNFNFAEQLLLWFDKHGRKDLPWQQRPTPYLVWLSEIMLQQTQVNTVIGYYQNFTQRFPDVESLAHASQDEVLAYWSGLGYYARARNLHKAAQMIVEKHQAKLPNDFENLINLPGIGRSTAGAILALAHQKKFPILDGNVKRVLTRFDAISGWPGKKDIEAQLWQRAEALLPNDRIANYIQAQMDLGATLCTRSKPDCLRCPLTPACKAYQTGNPTAFPQPKPKTKIPLRHTLWLVMQNANDEILLQQRPQSGIWGGLLSFPECETESEIESICQHQFQLHINEIQKQPEFLHVFTHFKLTIHPYLIKCNSHAIAEKEYANWYKIEHSIELGLPAPVKSFLKSLL